MKTSTTKTAIIFLSLAYANIAISGGTIQKCVDAKGAVTFTDHCPANQQATDTGMVIDSRSAEQRAQDAANIKTHLEDLDKQSKLTPTPTVVPVSQPNPADTEVTPTQTTDYDNNSYECVSSKVNSARCIGSNLTPAQKAAIVIKKERAVQLPARINRR
jgi:hypothetical protein